jgi:catechol 2,3-dioxygenase
MECEMETSQGLFVPIQKAPDPIDAGIRIGHVHLRTADIDRVRAFYVDVLGFDVIAEARDVPGWGTTGDLLFLSAGGYHHHLGFNTWKSKDGDPTPDGYTGLHHVAIAYPTRWGLADAYRRLAAIDWPIRQAESYPTHDAFYLVDPDGNTLELMWDKPAESWARTPEGHGAMVSAGELDLERLLDELDLA